MGYNELVTSHLPGDLIIYPISRHHGVASDTSTRAYRYNDICAGQRAISDTLRGIYLNMQVRDGKDNKQYLAYLHEYTKERAGQSM